MSFRFFAKGLVRYRWIVLALLLAVSGVLGHALLSLQIDPSMETLFEKKSEEYRYYRAYREKFGSDQMVSVAMATDNLFTVPGLRLLRQLTSELGALEGVERVVSLTNATDVKRKLLGVKIVPVIGEEDEEDLGRLRSDILSNELFRQNLVSEDGRVANLLVYLKPVAGGGPKEGTAVGDLRKLLAKRTSSEVRFYVAGSPVEQYDFIHMIRQDQMLFVPLITLLLIVTTWGIYRSFACLVVSMAIVFMTLIWTLGTVAICGDRLNLMTSLLAPVVMIITVVNSIHLMNIFFQMRFRCLEVRQSIIRTVEYIGLPCFLAQFTAALGFASLMTSPIPAIQSFGLYAAVGTAYSFIVAILLAPVLLPMLPLKRVGESTLGQYFLNHWVVTFLERLEFKWKWPIVALTALLVAFSVQGIRKIEIDSNLVKQMKPGLPLAVSTRFIDEHLTGVYTMGFVLNRKDGRPVTDAASLRRIDAFKTYLETLPGITKVNAITAVIRHIEEVVEGKASSPGIPDDPGRLRKIFDGFRKSESPELWTLISRDFREVRLEARVKAVGTREGSWIEDRAREYAAAHLAREFTVTQTGNVVLLGRVAKGIVEEQVQSFGTAFASILILIGLIFRSFVMALLAAIPNLVPVVVVYGVMGHLGIELSTTTAMISSVVMGLVVDASIHFLYRFRLEFRARHHYLGAMHHTFQAVSPALILSILILMAGFSSSVFGKFLPTMYFGLFTSLSLFLSLVATLIILPVLIVIFKPFGRQRLFMSRQEREKAAIHPEPARPLRDKVTLGSSADWT